MRGAGCAISRSSGVGVAWPHRLLRPGLGPARPAVSGRRAVGGGAGVREHHRRCRRRVDRPGHCRVADRRLREDRRADRDPARARRSTCSAASAERPRRRRAAIAGTGPPPRRDVRGDGRLSAAARPRAHHGPGHRGPDRPVGGHRQAGRHHRPDLRSAGSAGAGAGAYRHGARHRLGRARGHRGRHRRLGRGLRGLLARYAQPAHGQPRLRRPGHRPVRAGARAVTGVRGRDDGARQRSGSEGRIPVDARPGRSAASSCCGRPSRCARTRPRRTSVSARRCRTLARWTRASRRCTRACGWPRTTPRRIRAWRATTGWGRATSTSPSCTSGARWPSTPMRATRTCNSPSSYALRGDLDEAEREARAAVVLQEQAMSGTHGLLIVGARSRLGYVFYRRGQYDEAIREYRRELDFVSMSDHALRERTTIELCQKLAAAYSGKGDRRWRRPTSIGPCSVRPAPGRRRRRSLHALLHGRAPRDARRRRERRGGTSRSRWRRSGVFTRWRLERDPDFDAVRDRDRRSGEGLRTWAWDLRLRLGSSGSEGSRPGSGQRRIVAR